MCAGLPLFCLRRRHIPVDEALLYVPLLERGSCKCDDMYGIADAYAASDEHFRLSKVDIGEIALSK